MTSPTVEFMELSRNKKSLIMKILDLFCVHSVFTIRGRPLIMLRVTFKILTPPSPLHTNVTHFYTETLGEMLR